MYQSQSHSKRSTSSRRTPRAARKGAHGKVLLLGQGTRKGKNTTVSYSLARKLRFTVSVTLSRLGVADDGLGERKIEKVETRYGLRYKSAWGLGHELKPKNAQCFTQCTYGFRYFTTALVSLHRLTHRQRARLPGLAHARRLSRHTTLQQCETKETRSAAASHAA